MTRGSLYQAGLRPENLCLAALHLTEAEFSEVLRSLVMDFSYALVWQLGKGHTRLQLSEGFAQPTLIGPLKYSRSPKLK